MRVLSMRSIVKRILRKIRGFFFRDVVENTLLVSKRHVHRGRQLKNIDSFSEVEFKVFSQWGEDGIIQYLIHKVTIENRVFVEFGVDDYSEANTRFLLVNDNWVGLLIEGNPANAEAIKVDNIHWQHDLRVVNEFITKENINSLITGAGIRGDIGLLSIDIDGNDYWVWEAITVVNPRIVICEYNSLFGPDYSITVPYDPLFVKKKAHYSDLFFGASLPALCFLADKKGYKFVGSNSNGCNAFFVRKDLAHRLKSISAKAGYREDRYRLSRDRKGRLNFLARRDRLKEIEHLSVIDVATSFPIPGK